jgi:hypothetical protein
VQTIFKRYTLFLLLVATAGSDGSGHAGHGTSATSATNLRASMRGLMRSVSRLRGGADTSGEVTAFEVKGHVDYDRLVRDWGSQRINATLIDRIERLTGRRAHHLIRRGFFFSHRDLDKVLDAYEKGEPFYLYTGRGPSSHSLHVGHLVPFMLTKWLQEAFNVPVVIQLTDDEKFLWNDGDLDTYKSYGLANLRDILAVGFIPELTYVVMDTDAIAQLYPNALRIQRLVSLSTAKSVFGFNDHRWILPSTHACALHLCLPVPSHAHTRLLQPLDPPQDSSEHRFPASLIRMLSRFSASLTRILSPHTSLLLLSAYPPILCFSHPHTLRVSNPTCSGWHISLLACHGLPMSI